MLRIVRNRVLTIVPVLFIVSIGTFFMVSLVPGDPATAVLGENATPAQYAQVRDAMGLDKPIGERYGTWLANALHGDLGVNLVPPVGRVTERLTQALPVNLELMVLAIAMALLIAIPLGTWSAYRPGSHFDRVASFGTLSIISLPSFLAAIVLLLMFTVQWHVFPLGLWARPSEVGWWENFRHAFLPALTLALPEAAVYARLLRSDMISTLHEEFILAARAKGMPTGHILFREALRPSSFSLITLTGLSIGRLIAGSIIVEQVFSLPGLGSVMVNAARRNDFPLVQGGVLIIAVIYLTSNLLVDVGYALIDPRIRRGYTNT